jgi:predicted ABC-type ATPase
VADNFNPQLVIIAGPNGAGKSTLAEYLLPLRFGILDYVNADTIARGLSAFGSESVAIDAGRIMLTHLKDLAARRMNFAFETTLATRSYASWIRELVAAGYSFHLLFVALSSAELALERVADRVANGGHNIPSNVVRRRFEAGIKNFFQLYRPLAKTWSVYDNSEQFAPRLIASGIGQGTTDVLESNRWEAFARGQS